MNVFTPTELAQFDRDGFLIARGLVARSSCEAMKSVARRHLSANIEPLEYESQVRYPGAPASFDAPGGRTVRRLLQAYARDELYRHWATCPEIVGRLSGLLGPELRLSQAHHNCIMTKQPSYSSSTGWHQDIRYWAFERGELISTWLALGPEFPDNGCLSFLPGTHRMDIAEERFDDAKFLRTDLPENQKLIATRVTPALEPGDVVLFHCRTFHAAGNNRTDLPKWSIVFTYHALDDRPIAGTRSASLPSIAL